MRKFNTKEKKAEWFTPFEDEKDVKVQVKPFSLVHLSVFPSGEGSFGPTQMYDIWNKCVLDWKGIIDSKTEKPIPCTEENKLKVFDQDFELAKYSC